MVYEITTIKSIAPEELVPRIYVAVYSQVSEFVPFPLDPSMVRDPLVRVVTIPDYAEPLEVVDVCVPYVLVKNACGEHRTLDLRMNRLVRLPDSFGVNAMEKLRSKANEQE